MNFENASVLAENAVRLLESKVGFSLSLVLDETIEKPKAWVFFFNSKDYIESGDVRDRLAGNGPIVVLKDTGEVVRYGSTPRINEILALYE